MNVLDKLLRSVDTVRAGLGGSETVDGLEVYGRQEFRAAVKTALLLLRDNNLPAWETLTRFVSAILEASWARSTIIVTAHPAFMFIDAPHARQDTESLAGIIAHLACSCALHRTHEAEFPGRRVPRDVYCGRAARERCDDAYRECLLALGRTPESARGRGEHLDPK